MQQDQALATPGTGLRGAFARILAAAAVGAALAFGAALAPAQARPAPENFADLAEKLLPAVVNISTTQQVSPERRQRDLPQAPPNTPFEEFFKRFFEENQRGGAGPRRATSLGSGFIIDSSGYVVTNNHVIGEADDITVILHDDTQLKAKLVGRDTEVDLALLKVEPPAGRKLASVKFADSDKARIGDWVLAIGNPFGFGGTVTAGIISARARELSGRFDDYIQTDASINKGNSGGPLFNVDGEVVGINTAIFSPSGVSAGIGFSIPSNLASPLVDQLREFGRIRRGWIGVFIQSVTDEIAESFGLDKARGALVSGVTPNGPADAAKLKKGDVILTFNNRDISDSRKLPRAVAETRVGDTVDMVVFRDSKRVTLKIKVGEQEPDKPQNAALGPGQRKGADAPPPQTSVEQLGLTVSRIADQLRERYNIGDATKGVVVTRIADGSVAAEKGMRPGDVILQIDQAEVQTPEEFAAKVKEAQAKKKRAVLLLVERQGDQRFVALRLQQ